MTVLTPELELLGPDATTRTTVVRPGMCGPGSLFVGQVGDWTWDTVSALCDTNVYTARDADGMPTYLAFHYIHLRGGADLHVRGMTFGDVLHRRAGFLVRRFGYPVARLATAVLRGEAAAEVKPRTTVAVWVRWPGRRGVFHRVW